MKKKPTSKVTWFTAKVLHAADRKSIRGTEGRAATSGPSADNPAFAELLHTQTSIFHTRAAENKKQNLRVVSFHLQRVTNRTKWHSNGTHQMVLGTRVQPYGNPKGREGRRTWRHMCETASMGTPKHSSLQRHQPAGPSESSKQAPIHTQTL